MNIKQTFIKYLIVLLSGLILLSNNIYASDMDALKQQCAELGFMINTPVNGKCVLTLIKKIKGSTNGYSGLAPLNKNSIESAQQRTYERQQSYAKEVVIEQRDHEIALLRQQQEQQAQLQASSQQHGSAALGLLQILGAAAQGWNQGMRQSAHEIIVTHHIPTMDIPTKAHCSSTSSTLSLSKSVDTTCSMY